MWWNKLECHRRGAGDQGWRNNNVMSVFDMDHGEGSITGSMDLCKICKKCQYYSWKFLKLSYSYHTNSRISLSQHLNH